jgi:hypothetical protein
MKKLAIAVAIVSLGAVALIATAIAKNGNGEGGRSFHASLDGFQEVPSISTNGRGTFRARLKSSTELEFRFTYRDLEGALGPAPAGTVVGQAHIHFSQFATNGGIAVVLCGGAKPPCPTTNPATVEGTITASDVVGPSSQGIAAGEFGELIRAMRHGATYVNIHTVPYPNGEIRGQIDRGRHFGFFRGKGKKDRDD